MEKLNFILGLFPYGYLLLALFFVIGAVALVVYSILNFVDGLALGQSLNTIQRLEFTLESIAIITIALSIFELAETLIEEEVIREANRNTPTRVRRFISRFLIVVVVALSIETLISVFRFSRDAPAQLPYAAIVGFMAAALLAAWGLFVRLNRSAEELEPEGMAEAKKEDEKV